MIILFLIPQIEINYILQCSFNNLIYFKIYVIMPIINIEIAIELHLSNRYG